MAKTLYIIDGHAHIYAAHFAPMRQQLSSPSGEPTKATYIFTTALLGLIEKQKPDMIAVAMDCKAPTFRTEVFAEYKANRPPMPEELPVQVDRIKEILGAMRIPVLCLDGYEADDIIGTLAKKAAGDGLDVLICSKDKDILQLLDHNVRTYDIKTGKITDSETMKQEMGIWPGQIVDCLALEGDAIDNVPGVPLIGEKTARELIRQYGDLDNLYAHAEEIKGKRGENLRNAREQAYLSRRLVTLDCSVPVGIDYEALAFKEPDKDRLTEIFTRLGFNRLLGQLVTKQEQSPPSPPREPSDPPGGTGLGGDRGATQPGAAVLQSPRDLTQRGSAGTLAHTYTLIDTPEKFEAFLAELRRQTLISVDTETTSVNAMRAELVGLSFSWEPGRAFYLAVKGPLGCKHLDIAAVRRELGPILADQRVKKIGQNLKYDMTILRNAQMPLGGVYFDTMVASYVLDPERMSHSLDNLAMDFLNYESIPIVSLIGKGKNQLTFDLVDLDTACEYSGEDADITYQMYLCLKDRLEKEPQLNRLFHEVEMPLVEVLTDIEYNGVSIDTGLLRQMSGELDEAIGKVAEQIYAQAGTVFNVDSPKQLAEVLFDKLRLIPGRLGKANRSTDAEVLEDLADQHPIARLVIEYRTLGKLKNTYVDKLGAIINPKTGRVHTSFNQTVTATGRLSSSNPNLQNIPAPHGAGPQDPGRLHTGEQRRLHPQRRLQPDRAAAARPVLTGRHVAGRVRRRPGHPSLRRLANLRRAARSGDERDASRCKTVNFGIIYGQGALGLARNIGMSPAEAKQFIAEYFARYGSIRAFIDECIAKAKRTGYAETILGRRRRIVDIRSKNQGRRPRPSGSPSTR